MMANLPSLPTELIEQILRSLDEKELAPIRLISKTLHQKTLRHIGPRLFKVIGTDFSKTSLRRLQDLSNHPDLSLFLQTLQIKHESDGSRLGQGFQWNRVNSLCLQSSNEGVNITKRVVQSLKNCKNIDVFDSNDCDLYYHNDSISQTDCLFILLLAFGEQPPRLTSFQCPPIYTGPPLKQGRYPIMSCSFDIQRTPLQLQVKKGANDWRSNITDLSFDFDRQSEGAERFIHEFWIRWPLFVL
ncbi:hypothetical protein EJ08DRAFT_366024 [Tothia fuscella]|uniref:F-box domain-containing protein n=1 Tax=Tothia fuscella TaxID=1048955 RepID=A0A9P4TW72_9PEZI|nr:hypothetical protein EJ08DRAFT_366024 [Tothia fuscella]